jgi:hypothetical protein
MSKKRSKQVFVGNNTKEEKVSGRMHEHKSHLLAILYPKRKSTYSSPWGL